MSEIERLAGFKQLEINIDLLGLNNDKERLLPGLYWWFYINQFLDRKTQNKSSPHVVLRWKTDKQNLF